MGIVAVAGSRSLSGAGLDLVAPVCRFIASSGHRLVVGCATGADAAVLGAGLPPSAIRCLIPTAQRDDALVSLKNIKLVPENAMASNEIETGRADILSALP